MINSWRQKKSFYITKLLSEVYQTVTPASKSSVFNIQSKTNIKVVTLNND